MSLTPVEPPRLATPEKEYRMGWFFDHVNVLRLYFNRVGSLVNNLIGRHGGRFLDTPNGLFWDNADQPLGAVGVAQPIRFNQTYLNTGVSINGATTSEITVEHSGVYNFQFSGILRSGSSSSKLAFVWIRRGGVDVGYTAREYSLSGSGKEIEVNWDFIIDMQAGQNIQMMWSGDDTDLLFDAVAPTVPHPGIPSAVVAVTFVSALPEQLPVAP
jgi:hypothetical protein